MEYSLNNYKISILYKPLKIIILYLVLSLILFAFGPFAWEVKKFFSFWILNILYIFFFSIGWIVSISKGNRNIISDRIIKPTWYFKTCTFWIIINFVYEFITMCRRLAMKSLNLNELLFNLLLSIRNPGAAYDIFQKKSELLTGASVVGGVVFSIFSYMFEFISLVILLLSTIYFKQLSTKNKFLVCITYITIIISYLATGTNIGVFRVILIFLSLLYYKYIQKQCIKNNSSISINKRNIKARQIKVIAFLSIIIFLCIFNRVMQSRSGILLWEESSYNIGGYQINKNSVFFKILPSSLLMLFVALSGYITQGYQGMALALELPWKPTFLIGNSPAIIKILSKYSSIDLIRCNTYQYRLTDYAGWDEFVRWHSMYTWFANDYSFLGVCFVMFVFGFVYSLALKDFVFNANPYAFIILFYCTLGVLFIPCNNQIFQTTYTCFSFFTSFILWLLSRKKSLLLYYSNYKNGKIV